MDLKPTVESEYFKKDIPNFRPGDTVKVHIRILPQGGKEKERIQTFEGIVIARRGGGTRETFMVRKVSFGEGVEQILPLHSPLIKKIEVLKRGKVRRAKLYYLRGRKAKVKTLTT